MPAAPKERRGAKAREVEPYQPFRFIRSFSLWILPEKIRALNDVLRTFGVNGRIFVTAGIAALTSEERTEIARRVAAYDDFTPDNDPHGEHDFGSFEYAGKTINWKIDYYDRTLVRGSPDPADEAVTTRVLTIMLAEEY